jgi:hypothetical protein
MKLSNNYLNRLNLERCLVFLCVASWVKLPGVFYEKMGWDFFLSHHGHNLFPYFLPIIGYFIIYFFYRTYVLSDQKNIFHAIGSVNLRVEDKFFIVIVLYMLIVNNFTGIYYNLDSNLRMILPMIMGHFFYFFYIRFTNITVIPNVHHFFVFCLTLSILIILLMQLAMFAGLMPGITNMVVTDVFLKLISFERVNGLHIGFSSYVSVFLLFILLFHKPFINNLYLSIIYVSLFLVIIANQTRGAILIAITLILLSLFKGITISKFFCIAFLVVFTIILFLLYSDNRLFNLFDSSGNHRLNLMFHAIDAFIQNPIFGYGSEAVAKNIRYIHSDGHSMVVHSYYLRFLMAYGYVGIIIFLIYYKSMFVNRLTYINLIGLFVIFAIYTFETYLYHFAYIAAVFSHFNYIDNKYNID